MRKSVAKVQAVRAKAKQLGLTTVEYAVAGGILVLGIVAAFSGLGTRVMNIINGILGVPAG